MKRSIALIIYSIGISLLVACAGVIVFKLLFWPPCTPIGAKDTTCIVDGWSVAGLAATVLGVAAAILALLGAFAVAAWWSELNKRIEEQVADHFKDQKIKMQEIIKESETFHNETKETLEKVKAAGDLQELLGLQQALTRGIEETNQALMYLILGNQLVEHKKIAEAIKTYEKVKMLRPRDAQINYILGRTYRAISSYDQAIHCLETAIKETSDYAPAHLELGMAYRSRAERLYNTPQDEIKRDEEYDKAIDQIKIAIALHPDNEDYLGALAGTYRRTKDYKRALANYKRLLVLNPRSAYIVGNVAILAWHDGDTAKAREAFKLTEELATQQIKDASSYEPYWDYYDRGMARLILENKDAAMDDYRTAISLTRSLEHFNAVLDGLRFFKEVEDKYPIHGLDEVLTLVLEASESAEARTIGKRVS